MPPADGEVKRGTEEDAQDMVDFSLSFAFYYSNWDLEYRKQLLGKGVLLARPIPGNWQEEIGTTEAQNEVIAREGSFPGFPPHAVFRVTSTSACYGPWH
jgi:hypothetical protein